MVLCRFFINGNCRYGTKCHNEHIDVKLLIKNEMQGALHGQQWPLSCFGPFKDKPSIPNFIEDQSFEEVRFACYEAKIQGNFEQVKSGIYNMVVNARAKMESVVAANQDILNLCMQLYDSGSENKKGDQQQIQQPPNPFSTMINSVNPTQNQTSIFGQQSTFGGGGIGGVAPSNNGIFGVSNSSAGIFGGQQAASAQLPTNSIFGSTNQQKFGSVVAPQSSIFGNAASNTASTASIFGNQSSSPFGAPAQQSTGFGATTAPGTGTFSLSQIGQPPSNASTNIFGQAQQTTPPNPFTQMQQQQPTSSIFGQQNTVFGGNTTAVAVTQPQSVFGSPNTNIFAQAATAIQQPPPSFQQAISQQNTNFNGAGIPNTSGGTSSIFQQHQTETTTAATMHSNNIFGQTAFSVQQQQPGQIINLTSNQEMNQPPISGSDIFSQSVHSQQQQPQQFVQQSNFGSVQISSTVYSKIEDLNQEQIDWFKSDHFELGKIPTVPPPREFCG